MENQITGDYMSAEIIDISAQITGISYKPLLCKELDELGVLIKRLKTYYHINLTFSLLGGTTLWIDIAYYATRK